MGALLGFLPFVVFALGERALGVVLALAAAAAVSIALLGRDRWRREREWNLLEVGSALMFGALAAWTLLAGSEAWSVWRVRLWVDGGLMTIVFAGIALGRPFTLQYARRGVSSDVARSPVFRRTCTVIAGVWGLAFALLAAIDLSMVVQPEAPTWVAVALTLAVLAAAAAFTHAYPRHVRARAATRIASQHDSPAG